MLKKPSRKLTNNIGLKLLALFLSAALWMVVVNTEDPMVRKSMTVSVSMKNQDYITDMGKYMDVLNESNTVTFFYTTKRSVWDGISSSDFQAVADMEKIEAKNNGGYRVPVSVSAVRNANQITIETKQLYLDVALEDLGKQQFQIKANTSGMVADGCALGNVEIENANVVQVSGPASVINSIESVIATINVDGMSTDITDNVVPVFYDMNGEVIDTTKLIKSVDTVRINAQILNTKDVPLEFTVKGTPAEGYHLVSVVSKPQVVRVKGDAATLNMLDKIKIPAEVLDLSGATSSIEKTIDISTYLEKGVSLVISSDAKVNVTAEIEPIETKEYKIPVSNITANGLRSGYQLSYKEKYVLLEVNAGKSAHEELNAADIKGTVHIENLQEGTHMVAVSFDLDEQIYKAESVLTEIEITHVAEESESENTENDGGNTEGSESTEKTEDSVQTGAENAETFKKADSEANSEANTGASETNAE